MNLYHFKSRQPLLSLRATGEDFPINDIAWCPGNSTVFACVTVDARLQLWDLSVSAIDPVISVDTTVEVETGTAALVDESGQKDKNSDSPPPSAPAVNGEISMEVDKLRVILSLFIAVAATLFAGSNRYGGPTDQAKEDDQSNPVNKLIKALNADSKKKTLTCLLFGEKAPIVGIFVTFNLPINRFKAIEYTLVVGDNRGTVSLYRIFNPVTITHQGPLQQVNKLKHAVAMQTDPASAAMIMQSNQSQQQLLVSNGTSTDQNGVMM